MNKKSYFTVVAILSVILSSSTMASKTYKPPIFGQKDLPMILPRTTPLNWCFIMAASPLVPRIVK